MNGKIVSSHAVCIFRNKISCQTKRHLRWLRNKLSSMKELRSTQGYVVRIVATVLIKCLCLPICTAQAQPIARFYNVYNYDDRNGNNFGHINDLQIDKWGTIWVKNKTQLRNFDGQSINSFSNRAIQDMGLPSSVFVDITLDTSGIIWLIDEKYLYQQVQQRNFEPIVILLLSGEEQLVSINSSAQHTLLLGTKTGGIMVYDPTKLQIAYSFFGSSMGHVKNIV